MKKLLLLSMFVLMVVSHLCVAGTGKLFSAVINGNNLIITPTANHYYPSMGIKLTSNHTVSGCTPSSNGYCLFAAGLTTPKTLGLTGSGDQLEGKVCLSGPAAYSCQKLEIQNNPSPPLNPCRPGGTCRVFVSSDTHNGNLGGIVGANATCQSLANSASLGGSWSAWLSTSLVDAIDNIKYDPATTYVGTFNGLNIATPGNLLPGNLTNSISRDENGNEVLIPLFAWTGSNTEGKDTTFANCSDWSTTAGTSATAGRTNVTDFTWNYDVLLPTACLSLIRLYCFEVY